jgi:hypothetical protein
MAVWAKSLNRNDVWDAIQSRRTYALTGDNIEISFSINDGIMGEIIPSDTVRKIDYSIIGGADIDYIEILHNNSVIHRLSLWESQDGAVNNPFQAPVKMYLELGWANKGKNIDWEIDLKIIDGELLYIEPRFRGQDAVAPQNKEEERYAFSHWDRQGKNSLSFQTRTWGNIATTTPGTQGVSLQILGNHNTVLESIINGEQVSVKLSDLLTGPKAGYLGGFLTPAYCFHKLSGQEQYTAAGSIVHKTSSDQRDWYYLRVRQYNNQWAWTSPIWVEAN